VSHRLSALALWAGAGLLAGSFLLVLRAAPLADDPRTALCLSRRVLHLPCPFCGLTRATARLVQGDWRGALAYHPLVPLVALQIAAGWAVWGLMLAGKLRPPPTCWIENLLLLELAVFGSLWLGRLAVGTLP
jgi:Protein of unknown function (DUF2752)